MYKGNSWFGNGFENGLNKIGVNRIENKVWIGKKIQAMGEIKRTLLNK